MLSDPTPPEKGGLLEELTSYHTILAALGVFSVATRPAFNSFRGIQERLSDLKKDPHMGLSMDDYIDVHRVFQPLLDGYAWTSKWFAAGYY